MSHNYPKFDVGATGSNLGEDDLKDLQTEVGGSMACLSFFPGSMPM
jgi:hypothetical protein